MQSKQCRYFDILDCLFTTNCLNILTINQGNGISQKISKKINKETRHVMLFVTIVIY